MLPDGGCERDELDETKHVPAPSSIRCLWCSVVCWDLLQGRSAEGSRRTPRYCCSCGAWYCGGCKGERLALLPAARSRRVGDRGHDRRCTTGPCATEAARFGPDPTPTRPLSQRFSFGCAPAVHEGVRRNGCGAGGR
mmetsp:Transcript_7448/g.27319  ORF Transcript_7448/g.27319 Transcript_7448/m.27319 type:complete len:137 (-) Transcript_7448:669-1079(-)